MTGYETIHKIITKYGLVAEFDYQSVESIAKQAIVHKVHIRRGPKHLLVVDYTQGIAYLQGFDKWNVYSKSVDGQEKLLACLSGQKPIGLTINPPALSNVLWAVAQDADALNYTFEEWADNLGYSSDSIKAEKMYRTCVDYGLRLTRMLGASDVEKIRNCEL